MKAKKVRRKRRARRKAPSLSVSKGGAELLLQPTDDLRCQLLPHLTAYFLCPLSPLCQGKDQTGPEGEGPGSTEGGPAAAKPGIPGQASCERR